MATKVAFDIDTIRDKDHGLELLMAGEITVDQYKAWDSQQSGAKLYCKVSEKGGVSLYGMGRFPITLYGDQWDRLIAYVPKVKQFLADNKGKLSTKEQSNARKANEKAEWEALVKSQNEKLSAADYKTWFDTAKHPGRPVAKA